MCIHTERVYTTTQTLQKWRVFESGLDIRRKILYLRLPLLSLAIICLFIFILLFVLFYRCKIGLLLIGCFKILVVSIGYLLKICGILLMLKYILLNQFRKPNMFSQMFNCKCDFHCFLCIQCKPCNLKCWLCAVCIACHVFIIVNTSV